MQDSPHPSDVIAVKQALATERYKALFLDGFPAESRRNSSNAISTMEQWLEAFDEKPLCAVLIQSGALQPTKPRKGFAAWVRRIWR